MFNTAKRNEINLSPDAKFASEIIEAYKALGLEEIEEKKLSDYLEIPYKKVVNFFRKYSKEAFLRQISSFVTYEIFDESEEDHFTKKVKCYCNCDNRCLFMSKSHFDDDLMRLLIKEILMDETKVYDYYLEIPYTKEKQKKLDEMGYLNISSQTFFVDYVNLLSKANNS